MTISKTYIGVGGLNYVESNDLVMTRIFAVKRSGMQHDKYISGSANRTYIHNSSLGRVVFPQVFNPGGEKVFIIYKKPSSIPEPIPGVCDSVVINEKIIPDPIVGIPYSISLLLSGSAPFDFIVNTPLPSWATPSIIGSVFNLSGTPDAAGPVLIDVTISNCDGDNTDDYVKTINVSDPTPTFFVSNLSTSGIIIDKVLGIPRTLLTGSFPIHYLSGVTGVHPDYTGFISVFISGVLFPFTLSLYKNGSLLESMPVTTDDSYTFADQTFLSTDEITIVLN